MKKQKIKEFAKKFFSGAWQVLVILAYMKFYVLCFMGTMISLILSVYVLNEAGHDIIQLASSIKYVGYYGLFYLAIIMMDKIWGKGKSGN